MEKRWKRKEGKGKEKKEMDLVGLAFSWSLDDILNEKLFHGKSLSQHLLQLEGHYR
ncbi:hypothetical protein QJS10_CPB15g00115 [Acorus calamus]|uniref:Uncharacterized protein n=1 Tax=Acorus calamus TaxID=4465 RepID=A0AAV9D768_ACOCL|nr:hypothetical protein QJS10_CPB15g00115 [Acorus calamus]